MTNITNNPFMLAGTIRQIPNNYYGKTIEYIIQRITAISKLEKIYNDLPRSLDSYDFVDHILEKLDIQIMDIDTELGNISTKQRLVMVANHPFGAIEGLILVNILRRYRPDIKILANYVLERIPELQDICISVDPFSRKSSQQKNSQAVRQAIRWLNNDGCLVIFPAGEVSSLNMSYQKITDPVWNHSIGRIIQITKSSVLPVYFHGNNSNIFQLAGLIHPKLRTLLLPRELINKSRKVITARFGTIIPYYKLDNMEDSMDITEFLRLKTYLLKYHPIQSQHINSSPKDNIKSITPPSKKRNNYALEVEISELLPSQLLIKSGEMNVYVSTSDYIPCILNEIGRLREVTFRSVGEGTGKETDLDQFDFYYLHLFIWNTRNREIVGAYRIGKSDRIIQEYGLKGLYSYSLFDYSEKLLEVLNPSLELGRSFIRQNYQKSYLPLLLLWKGIGKFITRNPQYNKLFGPVSISSQYQSQSQEIMINYLMTNFSYPGLKSLVEPRTPYKSNSNSFIDVDLSTLRNINDVSDIINDLEGINIGIPILLKHYLKLGGKLLGFNVDTNFNNSIDGLIIVDLIKTEPRLINKYLGVKCANSFFDVNNTNSHKVG